MITEDDLLKLRFIRERYGAMLALAAVRWHHRLEVLAGIMMRESEGGLSKYLDRPGPEGRGDLEIKILPDGTKTKIYHGHGLMQIDDRSFPKYVISGDWKEPESNITFAAGVLAGKRAYLKGKLLGFGLSDDDMERATIAAYNCGEGKVRQTVEAGEDVDTHTAHGDYSRNVLELADAYLQLNPVTAVVLN